VSELTLSVVMFAYNEAENVGPVMEEALQYLRRRTDRYELILVDDGSTDATRAAAEEVAAQDDSVKVLSHDRNRGIGAALKTGYGAATLDWVTLLPADGQVPPEQIDRFLELRHGRDLVICHYPDRFSEADNFGRKVLSRGLRALTYVATGVSNRLDGAYLIRRSYLQRLPLRSETFFLNLELPIRAIRAGASVAETTLHIRPRRAGESKVLSWQRIVSVSGEMGRLGIELRLGRGSKFADPGS